jgi:hypothetical protein
MTKPYDLRADPTISSEQADKLEKILANAEANVAAQQGEPESVELESVEPEVIDAEIVAPVEKVTATGTAILRQARSIDKRLREAVQAHAVTRAEVLKILHEAKEFEQIHLKLGFASWPAYVNDVLTGLALTDADDQETMQLLSAEGLGQRAIAAVMDTSQSTVSRALRKSGESNESPEPATRTAGPDGKSYPRERKPAAKPTVITDPMPTEPLSNMVVPELRALADQAGVEHTSGMRKDELIVAINNSRPTLTVVPDPPPAAEKKRPRRPLPDAFANHVRKIRKEVESMARLLDDDRWAKHSATLADSGYRYDLERSRDTLTKILDALAAQVFGQQR